MSSLFWWPYFWSVSTGDIATRQLNSTRVALRYSISTTLSGWLSFACRQNRWCGCRRHISGHAIFTNIQRHSNSIYSTNNAHAYMITIRSKNERNSIHVRSLHSLRPAYETKTYRREKKSKRIERKENDSVKTKRKKLNQIKMLSEIADKQTNRFINSSYWTAHPTKC